MTQFDRNIMKFKLITLDNATANIVTFMESLDQDSRRAFAMFSHSLRDFQRDLTHTHIVLKRLHEEVAHDTV